MAGDALHIFSQMFAELIADFRRVLFILFISETPRF